MKGHGIRFVNGALMKKKKKKKLEFLLTTDFKAEIWFGFFKIQGFCVGFCILVPPTKYPEQNKIYHFFPCCFCSSYSGFHLFFLMLAPGLSMHVGTMLYCFHFSYVCNSFQMLMKQTRKMINPKH